MENLHSSSFICTQTSVQTQNPWQLYSFQTCWGLQSGPDSSAVHLEEAPYKGWLDGELCFLGMKPLLPSSTCIIFPFSYTFPLLSSSKRCLIANPNHLINKGVWLYQYGTVSSCSKVKLLYQIIKYKKSDKGKVLRLHVFLWNIHLLSYRNDQRVKARESTEKLDVIFLFATCHRWRTFLISCPAHCRQHTKEPLWYELL